MNDSWFSKLDKVIQYMTNNNGKKPLKKEPEIGSWLSDQLGFYREGSGTAGMWVSKERLQAWTEFMNKNEDQLLTKDEIWDKKLIMLDEFIDLKGRKPSETGDNEEVALLRWSYDQHKRVKPGTDRYEKWTAFTNKYIHLYRTYEESWKDTFDKLVKYVNENNKMPKQNGSTEEECRLARWITRQNMSLSRNELSEEHKIIWEQFNRKDTTVFETIQPVEICIKCKGKDRNGELCRNFPTGGNSFCSYHNYLSEYTEAQLQHLQLCKGCNKWKDLSSGKNQCLSCGERGKEIRAKAKTEIVLCKSDGCTFKKSDENDYCGKHQLCLFVDECKAEDVRPCRRYLHGCRSKLTSDYEFNTCSDCLKIERDNENVRRHAVEPNKVIDQTKQCTKCRDWKPLDNYSNRNNNNITLLCLNCRDICLVANGKRDKEHVNQIQRVASKKPERIAVKNEWVKANPEKVALKNLNNRNRNYPGSVDLTKEQFEKIIKNSCYYCAIIQEKGFNGIDRMDSTKGYEIDNCVSCCTDCNMMKGAVDNITFIQRVEHILKHNSMIKDGKKYPDAFANHKGAAMSVYKYNAERRGYSFELSEEQYYKLIQEDCYICGKKTDETHTNGVDRFDNEKGYTFHNSNACCGECNIMKKEMDYSIFMDKLKKIYENCLKKEMKPPSVSVVNILNHNKNKLSAKECKEISKLKKQAAKEKQKNMQKIDK